MVWQHFAHCTCFVLYLTLLKYSTLHVFHALLCILHCSHCSTLHIPRFALYFALLTLQHIAYSMLCYVFSSAHIAAHCKFHALLCILHCSHCSTFYIIHALFCIMRCSIATQCIFHALFCILHCSHCSKLQIRCFVLYFALHTMQHIAQS